MTDIRRRSLLGAVLGGALPVLTACAEEDDPGEGEHVNSAPPTAILDPNHCALSADGEWLMALVDGGAAAWSTADGTLERTLSVEATDGLALPREGDLVAVGVTKGRIELLDVGSGDRVRTLDGHAPDGGGLRTLRLSPDGSRLASAGEDGRVLVWDTAHGSSVTADLKGRQPTGLAFDPDGSTLAVGSLDAPVQLVDPGTGEVTRTIEDSPEQGVAVDFSRDGRWLVATTGATPRPGKVVLVGTSDWARERDLVTDTSARAVAVSPDSTMVAMCDRRTKGVRLVPLKGGESRTLSMGEAVPRSVVWSPDGDTVYAFGEDGGVALEAATGKERQRFVVG